MQQDTIVWTELDWTGFRQQEFCSSCEHMLSTASAHGTRTDRAPTVLVSLQPIKWRRRLSCNWVVAGRFSWVVVHVPWTDLQSTLPDDVLNTITYLSWEHQCSVVPHEECRYKNVFFVFFILFTFFYVLGVFLFSKRFFLFLKTFLFISYRLL